MGQCGHREGDSPHGQLIQDYLENETTASEEERFLLLLGEGSFRRQVARFAIDLGYLHNFAQQGMLSQRSPKGHRTRRRIYALAMVAATILISVGLYWMGAAKGLQQSTGSSPLTQAPTPPEASPTTPRRAGLSIARVKHVVGLVVRAASLDAAEGEIAVVETEMHSGQVLRTIGPDSFAVLQFADGTVFAIAGNSELVCTFDGARRRVVVTEGDLLAQVSRQPEKEPMVIETAVAESEVLGTKLSLLASLDVTELTVQDGEVRMRRLSDGQTVGVGAGETLVASATSDWEPQPTAPVSSVWEEDFAGGLPRGWRAGQLVHESSPSGSLGAVRAMPRHRVQGDRGGPFRIATAREWARGLFRIEPDSHLSFTYKQRFRGGFHLRVNTHTDPWDPSTVGTYEYRSRRLRGPTRNQWRTVSIPLRHFGEIDRNRPGSSFGEPPDPGKLVIMVSFGSPGRDPRLVVDRIWVTRGPPESAEILGEAD